MNKLPKRDEHPEYRKLVAGYTAARNRVAEIQSELDRGNEELADIAQRADATAVGEAVGDLTAEEAIEIRRQADEAVESIRTLERELDVQRKAVGILKGRIAQAKVDIGRELAPAWQAEHRTRFEDLAAKLLAIDGDLRKLAEFETLAMKQGINIAGFGGAALQHLSALGPFGELTVRGWLGAIRRQYAYLGEAA